MKKAMIFLTVLILLASTAFAAAGETSGGFEGGERKLSRLWYTYGGYTMGVSYEVFMLGEDYYLCREKAPSRKIDSLIAEELTQIITEYNITGWDGSEGNDMYALDGEDFSMSVAFTDGTVISAHGSNEFPDHYFEVKDRIISVLESAADNSMRDVTGIYRYEGEGFGSDFTITIARDGTYTFYEGALSSYMGGGEWSIFNSEMYLYENKGLSLYIRLIPVEDALVFVQDEYSDNFPYVRVPNGGRFLRDASVPYGTTARLTFDSFDGGGPQYRIGIEDNEILTYTADVEYRDENHEEMDGAGYSVFFDFAGLKPGTTQVTVRSESPLAGNEEYQYTATVDENLNVELEPTEEDQQLSE